jgi:uncharacterized Tic20 family protein
MVLFAAGLILVVGSCVPVVGSLYRFATLAPVMTWTVPTTTGRVHAEYRVRASERLAAGLRWRDSKSPEPVRDDVSFTLEITDAEGRSLQRLRDAWAGPRPSRTTSGAGGAGAHVGTARWLPPFAVADETVLNIYFAAEPADLEAAGTRRLELQLFRDVPEFTVSFFSALVLWILGILTVLIGAIWWLRHLAGDVAAPVAASPGDDERLWAMFCHLSAMLGYLLPFGQLIGPSVVWMAKRDRSGFIDAHGREALNFQISVMLYAVIALIACFVLIGFLLLFALVIFHVSMTLYASLRAQQGDAVHYPLALRILPARHFTSG